MLRHFMNWFNLLENCSLFLFCANRKQKFVLNLSRLNWCQIRQGRIKHQYWRIRNIDINLRRLDPMKVGILNKVDIFCLKYWIMYWYKFVPFTECKWKILYMSHQASFFRTSSYVLNGNAMEKYIICHNYFKSKFISIKFSKVVSHKISFQNSFKNIFVTKQNFML